MPARFVIGRPLAILLAVVLALAGLVAGQGAAAAARTPVLPATPLPPLRRPVPGPPARGFEAPATGFGPGHRGIDFAAPAGTTVTSPVPGVVRFAGRAGGTWWVTVEPAPAVLVSVGPFSVVRVAAGLRVGVHTVLGTAGPGHDDAVHLGLRVAGTYIDPLPRLAGPGRPRLVPLPGPGAPADVTLLQPGRNQPPEPGLPEPPPHQAPGVVPHLSGRSGPGDPARPAAGGTRAYPTGPGRAAPGAGAVRAVPPVGRDGRPPGPGPISRSVTAGRALLGRILEAGPRLLGAVGVAARWASGCGERARPASAPPNGNLVVGVAGLASSSQRARELDLTGLGYRPEDVLYFSYRGLPDPGAEHGAGLDPDGLEAAYGPADTLGSLRAAAHRLYDQLAALHARHPDRAVDLIAHSQGGLVAAFFMGWLYDPADPLLPRIDHVVTLATPHKGADLATTVTRLRSTARGRWLLRHIEPIAARLGQPLRADSVVLGELSEDSLLVRQLGAVGTGRLTAVGAGFDVVVTPRHAGRPGWPDRTNCATHGGILRDGRTRLAVIAALAGRPLPPASPGNDGLTRLAGRTIERAEDELGAALERWAGWAPAPTGVHP